MKHGIHRPTTEELESDLQDTAKRVLAYRTKVRTGMPGAVQREEMLFTRLVGQLALRGRTNAQILAIPYVREVLRTTKKKE